MPATLTQAEYENVRRARVIGWGLRWSIAFGVVLVLTALVDGLGWLWPVAIGIAVLSFGVILWQLNGLKTHIYEGGAEIPK